MNPHVISAQAVQADNFRCKFMDVLIGRFVKNPVSQLRVDGFVAVSTGNRVWTNFGHPVE